LRGVPRWFAVLAVLAVAATVCAFTVRRAHAPVTLVATVAETSLPADGFSSTELTVLSSDRRPLRGLQVQLESPRQLTLESLVVKGDSATAILQSGVIPGDAKLHVTAPGFASREIAVRATPDYGDAIGDGTPDFLRLHDPADRQAFRRWFALLAEAQFYRGKNAAPEIDDCAALLRFAYREALREHDAVWAKAMALPAPATSGDIRQYHYPYTPLESALFRVRGGSFAAADLRDGAFGEFAGAETLWRHNTFSAGREVGRARPGDLLFFRQDAGHMPFHAMIFVGRSQVDPGSERFVVYDTGPTGNRKGEIKRLSVAELLNYPDPRWRPIASNPAFLGVYRWNILRGAE
jgi:uncharacterized protein YfaT (DUF1175 family)